MDGIGDGTIAGAAAEIALERMRQIGLMRLIHRGDGHDHAGGAEAALEGLGIHERLLHRMQRAVGLGEAFDGGDRLVLGAECRDEAGMNRLALDPDGAGAAVAGIATLFHAKEAALAQIGAQALAGCGIGGDAFAVDGADHRDAPVCESSWRISSEKCAVRCRL